MPVEGPVNDRIDEAYRTKYRGSPYLDAMISARARAAEVTSPEAYQLIRSTALP
jgi:hypothetical protein